MIKINEMVVRTQLGDSGSEKPVDTPSTSVTEELVEEIVQKCVERIMELLEDQKER